MPEATELREHEPHPVGALAAAFSSARTGGKTAAWAGNEALEIKRIGSSQF
jgi:hypothetical protein